jgi:hypothetical protein
MLDATIEEVLMGMLTPAGRLESLRGMAQHLFLWQCWPELIWPTTSNILSQLLLG